MLHVMFSTCFPMFFLCFPMFSPCLFYIQCLFVFHMFSFVFRMFSCTNLLTRCPEPVPVFCCFLYFRKVLKEIFSEWAKNLRGIVFHRNEDCVQRRALDGPHSHEGGCQARARADPRLGVIPCPPASPRTASSPINSL